MVYNDQSRYYPLKNNTYNFQPLMHVGNIDWNNHLNLTYGTILTDLMIWYI